MARKRLIVLAAAKADGTLGSLSEVRAVLARHNTAEDGSARTALGTDLLHGPGMMVELPNAAENVNQAMVTMIDDEIALPVLLRICRANRWKMVDLETGRAFG